MPTNHLKNLYQYRVRKILGIIDGDTVDVVIDLGFDVYLEKRVRMAGLNAPESRTKDLKEKEEGLMSKSWLTEKFNGSKNIIIETSLDNQYGKFGRILGIFYVNDEETSINSQMLKKGLASPYMIEDFPQLLD